MTTAQRSEDSGGSPWGRRHRLARSLEHVGWQLQDMQAYLGCSDTTMTNYMHDRTKRISLGVLKSWAAATGTRWEWLRDGTGPWLRDGTDGDPAAKDVRGSGWNVPASTRQLHLTAA